MTARFLVAGRVQGVGYRRFVELAAQRLGLTGWTRNLADGRVEVHAQGADAAVAALEDDLRRGPRFAHVTSVERSAAPDEPLSTFEIRP